MSRLEHDYDVADEQSVKSWYYKNGDALFAITKEKLEQSPIAPNAQGSYKGIVLSELRHDHQTDTEYTWDWDTSDNTVSNYEARERKILIPKGYGPDD